MTQSVRYNDKIALAERVVETTYGDRVSVWAKGKRLNKFGSNPSVSTAWETVQLFQGSEINETFVSTNLIDAAVSTSGSDTQTIVLEGHTIDGSGNLTFVVQDVTLTGTTPAAIGTPLARATRAFIKNSGTFNSPQAAAVGTISFYDNTDGQSSGTPTTAAATKMILSAGDTQSEKCATSLSYRDYWFITAFSAGLEVGTPTAGEVEFRIEVRDVANGGVWRPIGREITGFIGQYNPGRIEFDPIRIVPKNHDIRVRAKTDSGTAPVYAEIEGYLALVRG